MTADFFCDGNAFVTSFSPIAAGRKFRESFAVGAGLDAQLASRSANVSPLPRLPKLDSTDFDGRDDCNTWRAAPCAELRQNLPNDLSP